MIEDEVIKGFLEARTLGNAYHSLAQQHYKREERYAGIIQERLKLSEDDTIELLREVRTLIDKRSKKK